MFKKIFIALFFILLSSNVYAEDLLQILLTLARQDISNKDLSNYQKLEKKIDDLLEERDRYAERINYYNKEINAFFNLNEDTQRYQDNLKEVNEIKEEVLKKITKIDNEDSRDRLLKYVDECRKIRRKSFETEGKVSAPQVLRLNFLITTVLKILCHFKNLYNLMVRNFTYISDWTKQNDLFRFFGYFK